MQHSSPAADVGCNGAICSEDYIVLKKHERIFCPALSVILEIAQASRKKVSVEMISVGANKDTSELFYFLISLIHPSISTVLIVLLASIVNHSMDGCSYMRTGQ